MPAETDREQGNVEGLAEEIAQYLQSRPRGADTLEGIARWWLARQRLQEAEERVGRALELLCHQGVLDHRISADGRVIYSVTHSNGHQD